MGSRWASVVAAMGVLVQCLSATRWRQRSARWPSGYAPMMNRSVVAAFLVRVDTIFSKRVTGQ
jgi:hypothetical protein